MGSKFGMGWPSGDRTQEIAHRHDGADILRGGQRIALESKLGHAHEHSEQVVVEGRGDWLKVLLPNAPWRPDGEGPGTVERGVGYDLTDRSLDDAHQVADALEIQEEVAGEVGAHQAQLRIPVRLLHVALHPLLVRKHHCQLSTYDFRLTIFIARAAVRFPIPHSAIKRCGSRRPP